MADDMTYCKNLECDIMECTRNYKHLEDYALEHKMAHLEGNPLFCKKVNWNGYQVKETVDQ